MITFPNNIQKIAFISQPEYFRFIYENDLDEFAEVKEFKLTFSGDPEDFNKLLKFDADINIFFRGEYIPNKILNRLNGINIDLSSEPFPRKINNHIEYTKDSLKRYLLFRKIRNQQFDYVFHYDKSSLNFMKKDGLILSGEFVFPVATDIYHSINKEKKWDLFFIGRSTHHREKFFGPLKHAFSFLHIAHGIWGSDLVNYICSSRINLNVHAEDEISWEPRLQMLLACGAFVISEPITPNKYLRPGSDYLEVSSKDEMFEAVNHFLSNKKERIKIANSGQQRVQEYLNSKKFFKVFLNDIYNNIYPKFKVGPPSNYCTFVQFLFTLWHSLKEILKNFSERVQ